VTTSLSAPAAPAAPAVPGRTRVLRRGGVDIRLWSPPDSAADEALPLLVVHDGPEYDELAGLTRYLAAGMAGKMLPRLRAALLGPGDRNRWYSASTRYASALCGSVLPALPATLTIGMGTSLGALAMLHAHSRYPAAFDALFLQSGSFFSPRFDAHERRFAYYPRIVRFVENISLPRPIPVSLTCGGNEENIHNNRLMTATLLDRRYAADLHEVPGLHNFPAWRDAFDPHLADLLWRACR
jgi:enterochelin esterase-like enzyme